MDSRNKHSHYFRLRDVQHLEADTNLLRQLKPEAKPLRRLFEPNKAHLQGDILWALLDVATPEEIEQNRAAKPAKLKKKISGGKGPKKTLKESSGKGKGSCTKKAATETVTETKPAEQQPTSDQTSGEGEKKDTPAAEGEGIPTDQVGAPGESGHSEGDDSVQ